MDAYHIVLSLHVLSLAVMAGGIAVFGVCYARVRAAGSLAEAAPWASLAGRTGWVFPLSVLGLLGSGAYLTHARWPWSTAWIVVSVAGLVLVALQGPLLAGPRSAALARVLAANGPGPLAEPVRRAARDRVLWIVLLANPGVVAGIAWNMVVKPGAAGALAAVVIGYAAGVVAALALTRGE